MEWIEAEISRNRIRSNSLMKRSEESDPQTHFRRSNITGVERGEHSKVADRTSDGQTSQSVNEVEHESEDKYRRSISRSKE